jgi:hypothetical protein
MPGLMPAQVATGRQCRREGELTLGRIGVKGAADTELIMRSQLPAHQHQSNFPDSVGEAGARLRLTKTTAKTTTKTV